MSVRILIGDCRDKLRELPDASVHCCVTSPPYFGLRDYGTATWSGGDAECDHKVGRATRGGLGGKQTTNAGSFGDEAIRQGGSCPHCGATRIDRQMGLEPTPDEYVVGMVEVFREVKRVLRSDGTVFLNIGDSYASSAVLSQSYRLREDLTDDQRTAAAVAMFGVRFGEHLEAGERAVPQVLPGGVHSQALCAGPALAGEGVKGELLPEPTSGLSASNGTEPRNEMGGDRDAGREVRLLRGTSTGVPNRGSHKRRRGGTPEDAGGQESQFHPHLPGNPSAGVPAGSVPDTLLQLQLLNRLLGILSSQAFTLDQIPDEAKAYFYRPVEIKPKDLIGIPWRLAFALQADGWTLRQDVIWSKSNPMPESVRDRCTKAHEYLFLLSKGPRYYFDADAIAEPVAASTVARWAQDIEGQTGSDRVPGKTNGPMKAVGRKNVSPGKVMAAEPTKGESTFGFGETRNKRSVWEVVTQPFGEAHFATFPPALIEPCVLAGCPTGGTVLDPFGGAGTTGLVADRLGRDAILIELNPEYAAIAERRLNADGGMFAEVKAA
jgi:DNA modification methylase